MDNALGKADAALQQLSALLAEPQYFSDDWKSGVIEAATLVEIAYRQLEGLTPPVDQQAKHEAIVAGLGECAALTPGVFGGIKDRDKALFDDVKARVSSCWSKLGIATGARNPAPVDSQPPGHEAARQEVHARVVRNANLRGGPGTSYSRIGTARAGDTFTVTGRTAAADWLRVTNEAASTAWIAAFLVEADASLQAVPVVP
jgi:hypothetical protein